MINKLYTDMKNHEMNINISNTKVMVISNKQHRISMELINRNTELIATFKYLEQIIKYNLNCTPEILRRMVIK